MHFDLWSKGAADLAVDCVAVGIFDESELTAEARALDAAAAGRVSATVTRGDFSGRSGETLLLTEVAGLKTTRVLLVGLGPAKSFGREAWRRACGVAVHALARTRIRVAALAITRPALR